MDDTTGNTIQRMLMEEAARYRDGVSRGANEDALLRWECHRGHRWDDALDVAQNVRCMNCAAERRNLEMRRLCELAAERGGALVSSGSIDVATSLRWRCAYGHVWEARADVAQRSWCAECARTVYAAYR